MHRVIQQVHHRGAYRALDAAYTGITHLVTGLDEAELARASRCTGWTVADVLFHMVANTREALVGLAAPSQEEPDVDYLGYWRSFAILDDPGAAAAVARHVRLSAAAYARPAQLVRAWTDTARAVLLLAERTPPASRIAGSGHTLATADYLATLAVEATVHHLDMAHDLPGRPEPRPAATEMTVRTLDGLLDPAGARPAWDERTWILKGAGRLPLTPEERAALGDTAGRFPLLR